MNATALALPTPLPASPLAASALPAAMAHLAPAPPVLPAAGITLLADTCVEQAAELLRLACRRGQLEDASAAARIALPMALPHSPHQALLQALAEAQPCLMVAPDERRLFLLRQADGRSLGVLRLRDNGRVGGAAGPGAQRWGLRDGNLELSDDTGHASTRFVLCGERAGLRLYLGQALADGQPRLLQELRCTYTRLSLLDPELVGPFCDLYDVDAMVSADLPAGATLLLAAPHNHADLLADALNQAGGLHFDGELLHPQGIRLTEGLLSASANSTLHAMRAKDSPWFARMMLGRSHDALGRDLSAMPVRGFTLAPEHDRAALDWAIADTSLRIVHVARSNLLAEFADILASQAGSASGLLHFEPERFGRFIEMKQRSLANVRQRLKQRNADSVEVDGSRLNAATVAELVGFLTDSPGLQGLAPSGVVTRNQRVIERFDNPEAVLPCLRALGCPGWAEVEGQVLDLD